MPSTVSALLFVRDVRRVTRFYVATFAAHVLAVDDRHAALDVRGFRLVIHEISGPPALPDEGNAPVRRESTAIRLDYVVTDVSSARNAAAQHGGQIDELPPRWAPAESKIFLGFDPEGNVFGVTQSGS
jgi:predicted enzyme related to lactoylglutathione lyase